MNFTALWMVLMCSMNVRKTPAPFNDIDWWFEYSLHLDDGNQWRWPWEKYLVVKENEWRAVVWSCKWRKEPDLLCQETRNTPLFDVSSSDCVEINDLWYNTYRCKTDIIGLWTNQWVSCLWR